MREGTEQEAALMSKAEFDIVMNEIEAIAEKVNAFPRHLQATVYRHLVDTLLDKDERADGPYPGRPWSSSGRRTPSTDIRGSNIDVERSKIRSYYSKHGLAKINDMEFAAFCAYLMSELASQEVRRDSIDERVLLEMFEIVGRDAPGNARSTLNNTRRVREYLDLKAPGRYSLSEKGRKYVSGLLRKEDAT